MCLFTSDLLVDTFYSTIGKKSFTSLLLSSLSSYVLSTDNNGSCDSLQCSVIAYCTVVFRKRSIYTVWLSTRDATTYQYITIS